MLVVAHGLGRSPGEWLACARAIDPEALVPDLPMLRDDARPDHAAAVALLLAALDTRGGAATWLGHSGGAHVVLEAALEHPDRVNELVLVAAAPSRSRLARVTCDVLVVHGEREPIVMAPQSNVEIVQIANAGHDPHLDNAEQLVAAVRRFRTRRR